MTTIFLVFLFILQIIGFYFLALLYMKVSKYDEFEKRQRLLMEEMDNSLAAYLTEVKDENERLVELLTTNNNSDPMQKEKSVASNSDNHSQVIKNEFYSPTQTIPVRHVIQSYKKTTDPVPKPEELAKEVKVDFHSSAIELHEEGYSIEQIAKILGKGKTEVELMIKFKIK